MNVKELIGMTVSQGTKFAHKHKYSVRIVREDDNRIDYYTADHCDDRVNIEADNGKITHAYKG